MPMHDTEPIMIMIVMRMGKRDILLLHAPFIIVRDKRNSSDIHGGSYVE